MRRSSNVARAVFLRLLAIVYALAFASLAVQLRGLVGEHGIAPVAPLLDAARGALGLEAYWRLPTLLWLRPTDGALLLLSFGGAALSVLLFLGVAPAPVAALLWVSYLSLVTAGREFLSFQWDNLLLESGFLAIFLAPLVVRSRLDRDAPPSPIVVFLLRWLLFRVMFASGAVKLLSGDPSWRSLTALAVHYETQPLPTWIGWWAFQLPLVMQRLSTAGTFAVELVAPCFMFFPAGARPVVCGAFVFLQVLIALTGNYGFFNLLTVALAILLLEDRFWPGRWRERAAGEDGEARRGAWPLPAVAAVAAVVGLASLVPMIDLSRVRLAWPAPLRDVRLALAPFRIVNGYGLFAVMTTTRPEIVVEGSADGAAWKEYAFRWKPGDLSLAPAFVAPHMPRLDWQMWFAALGSPRDEPWFGGFLVRLLEGEPEVLRLLDGNPFPDAPPRYVRALLYRYHFTDVAERRTTGDWWKRELVGVYVRSISLEDVRRAIR